MLSVILAIIFLLSLPAYFVTKDIKVSLLGDQIHCRSDWRNNEYYFWIFMLTIKTLPWLLLAFSHLFLKGHHTISWVASVIWRTSPLIQLQSPFPKLSSDCSWLFSQVGRKSPPSFCIYSETIIQKYIVRKVCLIHSSTQPACLEVLDAMSVFSHISLQERQLYFKTASSPQSNALCSTDMCSQRVTSIEEICLLYGCLPVISIVSFQLTLFHCTQQYNIMDFDCICLSIYIMIKWYVHIQNFLKNTLEVLNF